MRAFSPSIGRRGLTLRCCGAVAACLLAAAIGTRAAEPQGASLAEAAQRFLSALTAEQRSRASLAFDDAARADWHFVPRARPGVSLGELDGGGRAAAQALLAAALSSRGLRKLEGVLALEALLRELESTADRPARHRDPGAYYLCAFGEPGSGAPWGWRIEGHHLSLSFTVVGDEVSATPHFLGANPARVDVAGRPGLRVLGAEEDLALELARSLDGVQRARALLPGDPPADILFGPRGDPFAVEPAGIPADRLSPAQRELLERLVGEVIGNLEPELAARARERIDAEELDGLRFLWIGALAADAPHYWRIQGPRTVIELDDVQDGGNHQHLVWRDLERDLGADLLRRHRAEEHGPR